MLGKVFCGTDVTMGNGTLLNFGKRYEDNLWVIFDQWLKLHLGLHALSNQKILNGIYYVCNSVTYDITRPTTNVV